MKRKKISRMYLFLVMSGVFVTIIAMSVVYAALSSKLLINGNAEVQASSFGLKVEKLNPVDLFGDEYLDACAGEGFICEDNYAIRGNGKIINEPTISGTSINNFKVSLDIPGDMIGIVYKVSNVGTIPVQLIDIIESDFQFTSLNNSNSDVQWAIDNISFGTALEPFDGMDIQINDVLCPGDEALFSLNVQIFDDVDSIPSGGIEISNISYSYDFVQADQIMCER